MRRMNLDNVSIRHDSHDASCSCYFRQLMADNDAKSRWKDQKQPSHDVWIGHTFSCQLSNTDPLTSLGFDIP
jgi:hypothetical protein